jgi:hypothetical protein
MPPSHAESPIDTIASIRSFDQAWISWKARGAVRDLRMRRRMTTVAIVLGVGLVVWFSLVSLAA